MHEILVTIPTQPRHREMLERIAPEAHFAYEMKPAEASVENADIILGNVPPAMLKNAPKLRWIQLNTAGTDGYPEVLREGCLLTNATGAYGLAISEHMLAMLLELMKKLNLYGHNQQAHLWRDEGTVTSIHGSRTLVVGLGDLGGEFAQRMHLLGSTVTGIRRSKGQKPEYLDALYQMDNLDSCLKDADIVASCLPGGADTTHVFNAETFAKMKPGAYFLNVGRGSAVDSYALADALNSGHLAGAGLDVTEPEPLPKDHPLWDAKNLVLTPHVSGWYHLPETHERILGIAAENLNAFLAGTPLRNQIDLKTGRKI